MHLSVKTVLSIYGQVRSQVTVGIHMHSCIPGANILILWPTERALAPNLRNASDNFIFFYRSDYAGVENCVSEPKESLRNIASSS